MGDKPPHLLSPRVPLRGEGSCGGGGAPRDSAGWKDSIPGSLTPEMGLNLFGGAMQVLAGAVYSPCLFLHVEFLLCFCFVLFFYS